MIIEKAYAKINIGLDIVRKRRDGYHDIDTIMQTISLSDYISINKQPGISITCSDPEVPTDNSNTAYKSAYSFFERAKIDYMRTGAAINIVKNIPSEAGLGGGSSDAAAVLNGLNSLYGTNFGSAVMRELALEVGSDVPFFIEGGTQRALGRGEKLSSIESFIGFDVVLIMPNEAVSTAYAYSMYSSFDNAVHPDMNIVEEALIEKNLFKLGECLENTFESLVFKSKPAIEKAKHDILETEAAAASMTGSGAAVFGIYNSYKKAESAFSTLRHQYAAYLVKTMGG